MRAETLTPGNVVGNLEIPATPEKFKTNFPFITINGRAGTGKTSLSELIAKDFDMKTYDVGGIFRRWDRIFGNQSEVIDYATRDVIVDQRLDENTQKKMRRTHQSDSPVLIVSRLGGWIAKNLENEGSPIAPKVLLTVSREIAAKRVWERERKRNPQFDRTVEQVKKELRRRNTKDFESLNAAHPELPTNPMNNDLRDSNGQKVYDIIIITDKLTIKQVKEKLYKALEEKGFLTRTA